MASVRIGRHAAEYTSFPVDLNSGQGGGPAREIHIMATGSGALSLRTTQNQTVSLTDLAAGDSITGGDVRFYEILSGSVGKVRVVW